MADAFDGFLKIEGVTSESKDPDHLDWIDVESFNLGASISDFAIGPEGKLVADRPNCSPMTFTGGMHKGSPAIFIKCVSGEQIPKVEFHARTAGGDQPFTFLVIKLTDCLITSVTESASGAALPNESVTIAYTKIEYMYGEQDTETGGLAKGGTVQVSYDQAEAEQVEEE